MAKKKILLTGASGTVGYEVLKQLHELKNSYEVTVFDLKSASTKRKFRAYKKDFKIVYGDIANDADLIKVCYQKDIVIHLAAIIPPLADEHKQLSYKVNVLGTEKLLRYLELNSPKAFFLYSSSISVYGDRVKNPMINVTDHLKPSKGDFYGKTKLLSEEAIQNSNLDWSIFRLSAIMGDHKISKLMFHQSLETSLEIATPEDTGRAFVNAIENQKRLSKQIFNLGGGEKCRTSYKDFLSRSFKILGLGKLDFPPNTFADKNFHCGFYQDGDILNDILKFRKDDLESYFENEKRKVSAIKKMFISMFKKPIKKSLMKKSEPLLAFLNNDLRKMLHYFKFERVF